jgi:hypothetical protein
MITEELRQKMTRSWLRDGRPMGEKFAELAKLLINHFAIRKGESLYRMADIEFYYYCDSHRDIITYPRNCPPGTWFFHASGVDIAFESHVKITEGSKKPHLTHDAGFGGILIRKIEKLTPNAFQVIDGPMKSCEELFDQFDAFGNVKGFPELVPHEWQRISPIVPNSRHGLNPDPGKKVKSILAYNYKGTDIDKEVLIGEYERFLDAEYAFRLNG